MQLPILDQERADERCLGGQALIQAGRWAEGPGDSPAITALLESCFPTPAEASLVMALRQAGRLTVSLVATDQEQFVGHVAFSPGSTTAGPTGVGLAPLAVASTYRCQGIGAQLGRAGLDVASQMRHTWAVMLGEPGYNEGEKADLGGFPLGAGAADLHRIVHQLVVDDDVRAHGRPP
ncbi:N-acetyltransferase [Synechococcus sp. CBW1002]|uniref:GNAT family N-acetyltransferase n=1 Tax=Synechococcus sp. CBW1002 TaxID=1353134 RepID=UPI0018CCC14B|nr:N-acetyltransferase [Synechococcus sp. CBW1002]